MPTSARRMLPLVAAVLGMSLTTAMAQQPPSWGSDSNPSPTAGGSTSAKVNEAADKAAYFDIEYTNARKAGPPLIVLPGEIKSTNATFVQKYGPNNIADWAELELGKANFKVLERTDLGPMLNEFSLAYSLGDPDQAKKYLKKGKLKTTKWVVKFDILKAEPVAEAQEGFDGGAAGRVIGLLGAFSGSLGGHRAGAVGETVVGSVKTDEKSGVWIIGMRYKIMDANTTEQVATGYSEEKMELGAKASTVMGVKSAAKGGLTLDTLVQRLVQKTVWEIDNKYK